MVRFWVLVFVSIWVFRAEGYRFQLEFGFDVLDPMMKIQSNHRRRELVWSSVEIVIVVGKNNLDETRPSSLILHDKDSDPFVQFEEFLF